MWNAKLSPHVIPNAKDDSVLMKVIVPIHMEHFAGAFLHSNSEEESTEIEVRPLGEFVFKGGLDASMYTSNAQLVKFLHEE